MKRLFLYTLLAFLLLSPSLGHDAKAVTVPEFGTIRQFEVPDTPAFAFTQAMGCGWNLGNTFDAFAQGWKPASHMDLEKSWCGVLTTREMIQEVHAKGFSTIRVPVSWHDHLEDDISFVIKEDWLSRVETVVRWAIDEGMYVIVNTHHDVDTRYYYPDSEHLESSKAYLSAIWSQVAARFADVDEHLIFESMNEPRLAGTDHEWYYDPSSEVCRDSAEAICQLNQCFVDTVRAAGGYNAERYLMIPGYDASADGALADAYRLPEDTAEDKLLVSVHAYTPYSFALDLKGTSSFSSSSQADRSSVVTFMNALYERFHTKGIPVVIGEYGALDKQNLQDRVDFFAWYVASASARRMPCLVWDNNAFSGNGERFGFLDRKNLSWPYPEIIQAIQTYSMKPATE